MIAVAAGIYGIYVLLQIVFLGFVFGVASDFELSALFCT